MTAEVKDAVAHALKSGYKHIDAAFVYGNENEVGEGLTEAFDSGVKREDIFVTSKLWNTYHRNPEKCLDEGLEKLGLKYVDLYLMHWPVPMSRYSVRDMSHEGIADNIADPNGNHPLFPKHADGSRDLDTDLPHWQTWKNMENLVKTGKAKAIGVSNYSKKYLEELMPHCSVIPAANQIENRKHCWKIVCSLARTDLPQDPYLPQEDIANFCEEKGILIEAYSPLGSTGSPLFQEEGVQEVAKKHNVGPGTVLLSYQGKPS